MRSWMVVGLLISGACSDRVNPNVCCVTTEQCAALGIDELRPCGAGQACGPDHGCIAAECEVNADCSDAAPVCHFGVCEATCSGDADCAEVVGRTHCLDTTCVGCVDNADCSGSTAICDMQDHACRGCELDSECASGVCIEIDGVCADEARVVYAAGNTGATSGECPRSTPCKLDYALTKVRSTRDVVHLGASSASLPASTVTVNGGLILDGAPTELHAVISPTFAVDSSGTLTLEGLLLDNTFQSTSTGGVTRLFDIQADRSRIETAGGTLLVENSSLRGDAVANFVRCDNSGTLSIRRSQLSGAGVESMSCTAVIERNRFSTTGTATVLRCMGGKATVQNNVFVTSDSGTDMAAVLGGAGSVFRFNTVASTSSTTYSASALYCDAAIAVSNNIFAFNSTDPIQGTGTCTVTSSLFDTLGTSDAGTNAIGDRATFFTNLAQGDFHLAPNSPARDAGTSGLVDVDLEGTVRGTPPDIGAYEAP